MEVKDHNSIAISQVHIMEILIPKRAFTKLTNNTTVLYNDNKYKQK